MNTLDPDQGQRREAGAAVGGPSNPKHIGDLDISPAEDGYIVYQPAQDRIHFLNPTAVLILELCTGENSPEQIVELVKQAYRLPDAPVKDVRETLTQLQNEGLLL